MICLVRSCERISGEGSGKSVKELVDDAYQDFVGD